VKPSKFPTVLKCITKVCASRFHSLHSLETVELGVVIGKKGRDILPESAMDYVAGYTLAIDLTARNFQAEAKEASDLGS